ncbi:MAG: glycosyl hydrolase family 18 protein [Bacteroidota bacterium]
MRHFSTGIVLALVMCFVNQGNGQISTKVERLFYYVDTQGAFESLKEHINQITVIAPQSYKVDENGVVWGTVDPRVIALARKHNVKLMPLITNLGFDQALLHKLLADSGAVERMAQTLVHLCEQNRYAGIQLDFENLNMNDREPFTAMCKRVAQALHGHNLELSIAVVHRTEQYPGATAYLAWLFENWRGGYDLKNIAEVVDFVSVMTYSQHTRRTTPGPVAAIPWVNRVIKYFLEYLPPDKLSLGIPLYSEYWYTAFDSSPSTVSGQYAHSSARSVGYDEVKALVDRYGAKVHWDNDAMVNYAVIDNDGVFEYLYIEDARSFTAKLDLVRKYHLRGFSAWVLGNEDPEVWKILK